MSASEFGLSFKSFVAKGMAAQEAANKEIAKAENRQFVVRRQGKYLSRRCVWLKALGSADRFGSEAAAREFLERYGMDFPDIEIISIRDKQG